MPQMDQLKVDTHFILKWHKYNNDGEKVYRKLETMCLNFKNLNLQNQFVYQMTSDIKIAGLVGKFIYNP